MHFILLITGVAYGYYIGKKLHSCKMCGAKAPLQKGYCLHCYGG